MTENENSPENLRKYLESDDPAMVMLILVVVADRLVLLAVMRLAVPL